MSRLSFLVDDTTMLRFEQAKEKLGVPHGRDVFDHALLLLEEALKAAEDNKSFGIIDPANKDFEILRIPRIEGYRSMSMTRAAASASVPEPAAAPQPQYQQESPMAARA